MDDYLITVLIRVDNTCFDPSEPPLPSPVSQGLASLLMIVPQGLTNLPPAFMNVFQSAALGLAFIGKDSSLSARFAASTLTCADRKTRTITHVR